MGLGHFTVSLAMSEGQFLHILAKAWCCPTFWLLSWWVWTGLPWSFRKYFFIIHIILIRLIVMFPLSFLILVFESSLSPFSLVRIFCQLCWSSQRSNFWFYWFFSVIFLILCFICCYPCLYYLLPSSCIFLSF